MGAKVGPERYDLRSAVPLDLQERARWVAFLPGFSELPPAVLAELAEAAEVVQFPAGGQVLREGEQGNSFYLILEGHAEVTTWAGGEQVPLALLGTAEWFGELALLAGDLCRHADVTALTPLTALMLPGEVFAQVLGQGSELREAWARAGELLLRIKFVREAAPFLRLPPDRLRRLARDLERRPFRAGEALVRQGEVGEECHLLTKGRAQVVQAGEPGERVVAELTPGTLFGEVALISAGPRAATVRAESDGETLVLRRTDLLAALEATGKGDRLVAELLRHRGTLQRRAEVEVHTRTTPEGEVVTVLRDPHRVAYLRLGPLGRFLWERLDGRHTLREIVVDYFKSGGAFSPQRFAEQLIDLAREGFLEGEGIETPTERRAPSAGLRWRWVWQWSISGIDPWVGRLYRICAPLFGMVGRPLLALVTLLGSGLAVALVVQGMLPAITGSGPQLVVGFLLALLNAAGWHELGHALAAKGQGRSVPALVVGWRYWHPVLFIDTSESWLAPPRERMVVNLAGSASNLLFAALGTLVGGWWLPHEAVLILVATSYGYALLNLHPWLPLDGYYLLLDSSDGVPLPQRPAKVVWGWRLGGVLYSLLLLLLGWTVWQQLW